MVGMFSFYIIFSQNDALKILDSNWNVYILNNNFLKKIFIWIGQSDFDTIIIKIPHLSALAKRCK